MHHGSEYGDNLDRLLVRALERRPEMTVSADFAARVTNAVPATDLRHLRGNARVRRRSVGRSIGVGCVVLLCLAMLLFTPHTRSGDGVALTMQCALCLGTTCLMLWLTLDPSSTD